MVAELTIKYGIPNARLFPFGASFAKPVAPNDTEEERRARNRRVQLVKKVAVSRLGNLLPRAWQAVRDLVGDAQRRFAR